MTSLAYTAPSEDVKTETNFSFLLGVGTAYAIFGLKREEVTGEWRRLYNEELNDLYSSPCIVWVITLRRMRWAGHVARMGDRRGVFIWGNLRERGHFRDPGVDGRIILRWIFRK